MVLAAGESPAYLGPVVALLVAAGLVGYISIRLRIVPIVGFLLAGVLIGPHQLGLVDNTETVEAAADIGVMLLLFTIGVEFSLGRLAEIKTLVLVGGGLQVLLTTGITAALVMAFGGDWNTALFTGMLVALSSTAIVLKVLAATGRSTQAVGQSALGVLIFQDLAVVLMVLIVPLLGAGDGTEGGSGLGDLVTALGTAAVVLVLVLVIARKIMPPLLERVARTCSPEVFLLTVVALGLGTAYLTSLAGVSVALGAFLAGLVVSESRHSAHALGEILPLQILFSAVFFVSIGMLLDLGVLLSLWWLVLLLAIAVIAIKLIATYVALRAVRVAAPSALAGAFLLAQIGEFSFVLQRSGSSAGLEPAGLGADGEQILIAVTVALMVITPLLSTAGERLGTLLQARAPRAHAPVAPEDGLAHDGRALILGWGPVAAEVAATLAARRIPVTVTTLSPDLAEQAESAGHHVVRGDPHRHTVLEEAGLDSACLVVICENSSSDTGHLATVIRQFAPAAAIVVRPIDAADPAELVPTGADRIVDTPRAAAAPLVAAILDRMGLTEPGAAYPDPTVPLAFEPDPSSPCHHTSTIAPVLPTSAGCLECLRLGERDWVHLRTCLACGHVGCCDSSPGKHAAAHAEQQDHPIAASAEPGEQWAWCYLDQTEIGRAR